MVIELAVAQDREQVGGKAKRLSSLIGAGLLVKKGVVITTSEIENILATGRVSQKMLDKTGEILKFLVAVRSSAVGEDGALTWAGQFKTRLSVSFDAIEEAILECASAVSSDAVSAYAQSHGVARPKLALIIQEMVNAEVAGVLFTKHPINGHAVVIEAIEGVGEFLVSGQREPCRLYVNPVSREVVKAEGASIPVLGQAQIDELCRLGKLAKKIFGKDQDIEWAIERNTGTIFLLQSRDITTLNRKGEQMNIIGTVRNVLDYETSRLRHLGVNVTKDVLSDQNIAELLTPHPCQMAFGLFTYLFAHGEGAIRIARNEMSYDIGSELDIGFFHLVGGQPRCSIVHDALTYRVRGVPLPDYAQMIQYYLDRIEQDSTLANYPEVVLYDQNPSEKFLVRLFGKRKARQYRQAYNQFFGKFREIETTLWSSCRRDFLRSWRARTQRQSKISFLKIPDLCKRYGVVANLLRTEACCMFVKVARLGFFAYAHLRNLLDDLFGQEEGRRYLDILTSGIPLADNPNLRFSVELAKIRNGETSEQKVIEEFGHLAMHELEISVPRYRENPEIIRVLAQRIADNPQQAMEESVMRSRQLKAELLAKAGAQSETLDYAIRMAREYLPLRELVKFEYLRGYDLLRQIALRIERLLKWEEGSVFHLDPQEIFASNQDLRGFAEIVARRVEEHEANQNLMIPSVIFSDHLEEMGQAHRVENGKVFRGIGVTDVITEGKVVVVHSSDDRGAIARLCAGSILVTVTTDPAWSPMLSVVGATGGLVTEVGGLLAHGAIYAREIGMAAVLNIPGITKVLRTGIRVRVNGREGNVEILD